MSQRYPNASKYQERVVGQSKTKLVLSLSRSKALKPDHDGSRDTKALLLCRSPSPTLFSTLSIPLE